MNFVRLFSQSNKRGYKEFQISGKFGKLIAPKMHNNYLFNCQLSLSG